ncbi:hypothetical protein PINS_up010193 [Pythium insidiosum]|nr:hypothetical protein PINS_up010193 [Pythium insidiosum]
MIDDFSGHWTEKAKAHAAKLGIYLIKVPPSWTSVCQPADISWNRPFKTNLRSLWTDAISSQLHQRPTDARFKLAPPTRDTMTIWITVAWKNISPATIASGFSRLITGEDPESVDEDLITTLSQLHLIDMPTPEDDDIQSSE